MLRLLIVTCVSVNFVIGNTVNGSKRKFLCVMFVEQKLHLVFRIPRVNSISSKIYIFIFTELKCNSEEILRISTNCPPLSTNCVENNGTNGTCECIIDGQTFNSKYTTHEDYCVNSIDVDVNSTTSHPESGNEPPGAQSTSPLIAGISISLVFAMSCIFVCKKLHVYQRFRNIRRIPRSRYEDVMLGTDDPPLI